MLAFAFVSFVIIFYWTVAWWPNRNLVTWNQKKYWVKIAKKHSIRVYGVPNKWEQFFEWDWKEQVKKSIQKRW